VLFLHNLWSRSEDLLPPNSDPSIGASNHVARIFVLVFAFSFVHQSSKGGVQICDVSLKPNQVPRRIEVTENTQQLIYEQNWWRSCNICYLSGSTISRRPTICVADHQEEERGMLRTTKWVRKQHLDQMSRTCLLVKTVTVNYPSQDLGQSDTMRQPAFQLEFLARPSINHTSSSKNLYANLKSAFRRFILCKG
jgi:hypothetical protein